VRTTEATKIALSRETDCGIFRECRAGQNTAKAYVDVAVWNGSTPNSPACAPRLGVDGEQVRVGLDLNAGTRAKIGRLARHMVIQ
jgi:hypothetical protein